MSKVRDGGLDTFIPADTVRAPEGYATPPSPAMLRNVTPKDEPGLNVSIVEKHDGKVTVSLDEKSLLERKHPKDRVRPEGCRTVLSLSDYSFVYGDPQGVCVVVPRGKFTPHEKQMTPDERRRFGRTIKNKDTPFERVEYTIPPSAYVENLTDEQIEILETDVCAQNNLRRGKWKWFTGEVPLAPAETAAKVKRDLLAAKGELVEKDSKIAALQATVQKLEEQLTAPKG
jgi:hypothetical protein